MTMIPCMVCSGDGVVEQNRNCSTCGGSGEIEATFGMTEGHRLAMFNMVTELITNTAMPSGVFRAYHVLECLDATELAALTDTQKDGVFYILACGLVDLNDGKVGKTRFWDWFGAESTTVANLTELLT